MTSRDAPRPLTAHLEELRSRLLFCLAGLCVFAGAAYFFVDPILTWLARPVGQFVFTSPAEAFFLRLKIAFGVGAVLSFPIFIFHAWHFIAVALSPHARSWVKVIIPFSVGLFGAGLFLGLFVVAPAAVRFLLHFSSPTLRPMISLDSYLSFLLWMILGFGVFFQLPLAVLFLCRIGVVTSSTLRDYRKHAVLIIFVVAAFMTPGPDIFSQLVMGVPAYLLFEASLLLAGRFEKK